MLATGTGGGGGGGGVRHRGARRLGPVDQRPHTSWGAALAERGSRATGGPPTALRLRPLNLGGSQSGLTEATVRLQAAIGRV